MISSEIERYTSECYVDVGGVFLTTPPSATSDKCLRGVGVLLRFICIILELKASASSPFAGPRPT